MERLKLFKVAGIPGDIVPDAVYLIKKHGQSGFDMKVSNSEGNTLYPLNCCNNDGGENPGNGTVRPYRSFTAMLLQNGQEAPVVIDELENEFGMGMEFAYHSPGVYSGFMHGAFTGRTIVFCNARHIHEGFPRAASGLCLSTDEIALNCTEDDNYIQLEVRVYP